MAKVKQAHLEGLEPPSIKEIDIAAEEYVDTRNKRMKLLVKEMELQGELAELMKKHQLKTYEFDGQTVEVVAKEKVKVRKNKEAGGEDDAEED